MMRVLACREEQRVVVGVMGAEYQISGLAWSRGTFGYPHIGCYGLAYVG